MNKEPETIEKILRNVLATDVSRVDPIPKALAAIHQLIEKELIGKTPQYATHSNYESGKLAGKTEIIKAQRQALERVMK